MVPERVLQGPFSDAMTHAGQLALLRRLAGSPMPPEDFFEADVDARNVAATQPGPVSPDAVWPEAPPGWTSPGHRKSLKMAVSGASRRRVGTGGLK